MKLQAVYFVPRDETMKPERMDGIMWGLSRCQSFFLGEAGVFLNWSVSPNPILGSLWSKEYDKDFNLILEEAIEKTHLRWDILGVFSEGNMHDGAFGGTYANRGYFVLTKSYLEKLGRRRADTVLAHEIGHALGLPDRQDGFSIMSGSIQCGGLERHAFLAKHRAHLIRDDREALRAIGRRDGPREASRTSRPRREDRA